MTNPRRPTREEIDELLALLTWIVRDGRFCEGYMDSCFEEGIPQAALKRLAEL